MGPSNVVTMPVARNPACSKPHSKAAALLEGWRDARLTLLIRLLGASGVFCRSAPGTALCARQEGKGKAKAYPPCMGSGPGAVLARTINSGSILMDFGYGAFLGALILRKSVSAAVTPIWRSGCRTVVRPGC